jgi:hypothetical protein
MHWIVRAGFNKEAGFHMTITWVGTNPNPFYLALFARKPPGK